MSDESLAKKIADIYIALEALGVERRIELLEARPTPEGRGSSSGGTASSFTQAIADSLYVHKGGEVLTGDYEFPVTGFIMNDGSKRYRVTVDSTGHLVTTEIVAGTDVYYASLWGLFANINT